MERGVGHWKCRALEGSVADHGHQWHTARANLGGQSLGFGAHLVWRNPRKSDHPVIRKAQRSGELPDCVRVATVQYQQRRIRDFSEFATQLDCPVPLFATSAPIYTAAMASGYAKDDTAVVCAVLEKMAGVKRAPAKKRKAKTIKK